MRSREDQSKRSQSRNVRPFRDLSNGGNATFAIPMLDQQGNLYTQHGQDTDLFCERYPEFTLGSIEL